MRTSTAFYVSEGGTLAEEDSAHPTAADMEKTTDTFLAQFIQKSSKWFATPLRLESVKKRLFHSFEKVQISNELPAWYLATWAPRQMMIKRSEFHLHWRFVSAEETEPVIPRDFLGAPTPRAQSPVPVAGSVAAPVASQQPEVKQIQIHGMLDVPDAMVAIGDLPLADPHSSFQLQLDEGREDRHVDKKLIREARLRAALAKLKAERLANRYYERYGAEQADSDSSDLSSYSSSEGSETGGFQ